MPTAFELTIRKRGQRFGPPYPARACIQVSRLPGNARVEIQVIAVKR